MVEDLRQHGSMKSKCSVIPFMEISLAFAVGISVAIPVAIAPGRLISNCTGFQEVLVDGCLIVLGALADEKPALLLYLLTQNQHYSLAGQEPQVNPREEPVHVAWHHPGPRLHNIQFESAGDSDSDSDEHLVRQVRRRTRSAAPMAPGPIVTLNSDDEELNETPPAPRPSRRGRGTGSAAPTLQPRSTHSNQNVIHSADKWHGYKRDTDGYAWPEPQTLGQKKSADCEYFFGIYTLDSSQKCRICG
ncbi:hypothetical protein B0H11DRAFT_1909328 [Mycena galericulata]|nr:hypothetical protein B0H11DRAFT_1909328 [Mycena galericulata]